MLFSEALGVACDVLRALRALHARGLAHQRLRPGNVLLGPAPGQAVSGRGSGWAVCSVCRCICWAAALKTTCATAVALAPPRPVPCAAQVLSDCVGLLPSLAHLLPPGSRASLLEDEESDDQLAPWRYM